MTRQDETPILADRILNVGIVFPLSIFCSRRRLTAELENAALGSLDAQNNDDFNVGRVGSRTARSLARSCCECSCFWIPEPSG
jgi:hypothetical protein